ncbi:hypothetical protein PH5382_03065 [Phaeobacter sp. CECT 5382]|uniref:hypothetical protein n=1 Tax=Phaeobacter sp. CECT 5382 TaxID=1712645 RepID=UPI0006DBA230|nr:hypothetical protein [Phaeobacter sp. CECT 5382]CUH89119.1 hypothetical protein PH5382_03065 [Phaeobacter sp. CECT 5382]
MKFTIISIGYIISLFVGWFGWQLSAAYGGYLFVEHDLGSQSGWLWFFSTTLVWGCLIYGLIAAAFFLVVYAKIAREFDVDLGPETRHGGVITLILICSSLGSCAGTIAGLPDNPETEFLYKPVLESEMFN